jgi:hypothetical protein
VDTSRKWRDLCWALLIGCVATLIPLGGKPLLNSDSAILNGLGYVLALLALPGFWVALLAGRGVHGMSPWLVGSTNGFVYTGIAYWLFKRRSRARIPERDGVSLAQDRERRDRDQNMDQGS